MKTIYKRTILVDLDGVLNIYTGNYDPDYIPPMKKGTDEFLKKYSKKFDIVIHTTRNLLLTAQWLVENGLEKYVQNVTNVKQPAYLIIDDRCIKYNGDFAELEKEIDNFTVWYKNV